MQLEKPKAKKPKKVTKAKDVPVKASKAVEKVIEEENVRDEVGTYI